MCVDCDCLLPSPPLAFCKVLCTILVPRSPRGRDSLFPVLQQATAHNSRQQQATAGNSRQQQATAGNSSVGTSSRHQQHVKVSMFLTPQRILLDREKFSEFWWRC